MHTQFPTRQLRTDLPAATVVEAEKQGGGAKLLAAPMLFKFFVGQDSVPVSMTEDQVRAVGDAFTDGVLLSGANPQTLRELLAAIDAMMGGT